MQSENLKVYDLTVSKIRCTNCSKKIKSELGPIPGMKDVKVNVLAEKVIVTFDSNICNLKIIEEILVACSFKIVSVPQEIILDATKLRKAQFLFKESHFKGQQKQVEQYGNSLKEKFPNGITEIQVQNRYELGLILQVSYLPDIIKGRQLYDEIESFLAPKTSSLIPEEGMQPFILKVDAKEGFEVFDELLEAFKNREFVDENVTILQLILAFFITVAYLLFIMILPMVDGFKPAMMYPEEAGIFSIYLILGFLLTVYTIWKFGARCFYNAFINFKRYRQLIINSKTARLLNMESLVTLGSVSAFIMSMLLVITYAIETQAEMNSSTGAVEAQQDHGMDMQMGSKSTGKEGSTSNNLEHMKMERIMNIMSLYESTALILTVITIGKFFEGKAKNTILTMQQRIFPSDQLLRTTSYTYIEPKNQKYDIESEKVYEVSLLEYGDLITLKAGMKLLCDGVILKGSIKYKKHQFNIFPKRAVDSICYGQDDPFAAQPGTRLKSGADILEGECTFQIECPIESSMLFQVAKQLNVAQSQNDVASTGITAIFQTLADHFVKGVIILALIVLFVWLLIVGMEWVVIDQYCVWCFPFERSISILVASCPCALGLAVPSVIIITLNLALQEGILIKKNTIFEEIAKVKHIMFDKTGTLFTKIDHINDYERLQPQLWNNVQLQVDNSKEIQLQGQNIQDEETTLQCIKSLSDDDLWNLIGIIEKDFKHPLANLLYMESVKRSNSRRAYFVFDGKGPSLKKTGILANMIRTDRQSPKLEVLLGNVKLMQESSCQLSNDILNKINEAEKIGQTVILLAINKKLVLFIQLDNKSNLRPEAKQVIQYLQNNLKKEVYILSGDQCETVYDVGGFLNIPKKNLLGEMDAVGKRNLLKKLKSDGSGVMMIGDGLNDVLSLQEAGVGVSINAKSELNLLAADVIILNENLWKIVILFNLMNLANKVVYINLVWAFAYNIIIAPVAAGAFYSVGFTISPMISSAAMSISSIIVVLISNTMRLFTLDPSDRRKTIPKSQVLFPFKQKKQYKTLDSQPSRIEPVQV